MKQYLDLVKTILEQGEVRKDRTGTGTKQIFGTMERYDLRDGKLPLITTRKLGIQFMIKELLWFLKGSGNCDYLDQQKVKIWKPWTEPTTNSIGPLYPVQLRNWPHVGVTYNGEGLKENDRIIFKAENNDDHETIEVYERHYDQLANLIQGIKDRPHSRRHLISYWNVPYMADETKSPHQNVLEGRAALSACFPPGTLISTPEGYRSIEDIKEGDIVYSATLQPRRVRKTYKVKYDHQDLTFIKMRYFTVPLVSTPNHKHILSDGRNMPAEYITDDDYLTVPYRNQNILERNNYTLKYFDKNKELIEYKLTKEDYFTLGYYLGNGWTERGSSIFFAIPEKKQDYIVPLLRKTFDINKIKRGKQNINHKVDKFTMYNSNWGEMLVNEFGHLAHNKKIPEWIFISPYESIQEFINGYIEADGCFHDDRKNYECVTVSEKLAYGLQRLLLNVGEFSSISYQIRPEYKILQGRLIKQRNTFSIRWKPGYKSLDSCYKDSNNGYVKVKENIYGRADHYSEDDPFYVYNLDVEEEHTYIANNIATNNCHTLLQFNVSGDELSCMLFMRSSDVMVGRPTNIAQYSILTHMIAQVCGLKAKEFIITSADTHIYLDHIPYAEELIKRQPYQSPSLVLNPEIKDIDDFKLEDFTLVNYFHGEPMKLPVAV